MQKGQSGEGVMEDYEPGYLQELQTQMPVGARLASYWAGFNTQEVVRPMGNKKVKKIKYITPELYFFMGYDSSLSSIKKW